MFCEIIKRHPDHPVLILTVSSMLRDFMGLKNFVRLLSLKTASSVYPKGVEDHFDEIVVKASKDKCVLIRKAATIGMHKVEVYVITDQQDTWLWSQAKEIIPRKT